MPGFDAIREEETITRVHRGGVEGITTIGSAACCARSRFAVVDAEVIVQPTFHRYRAASATLEEAMLTSREAEKSLLVNMLDVE